MHADLVITMLDGDLGAVTDPDSPVVLPRAEELCWCGCITCFSEIPDTTDDTVAVPVG